MTSNMPTRYPSTPRTAKRPMAFTSSEFFRGAFRAWVLFIVLNPLAIMIGNIVSITSSGANIELQSTIMLLIIYFVFGIFISFIAMLVFGIVGAYIIGELMKRINNFSVHRIVFFFYGIVVGAISSNVILLMFFPSPGSPFHYLDFLWIIIPSTLLTGIVTVLGWNYTVKKALQADAAEIETPLRLK